jgi:hypothetical protein
VPAVDDRVAPLRLRIRVSLERHARVDAVQPGTREPRGGTGGAKAVPTAPPSSGGRILLRVFCHATGARVILILEGYDKGKDPSPRRQQREITRARAHLNNFGARKAR